MQIQIAQLNKNIGKSDIKPDLVNQQILGEISDFSIKNEVNLEQLEATHAFKTVDFTIYSNLIAVEGTFNGILELVIWKTIVSTLSSELRDHYLR